MILPLSYERWLEEILSGDAEPPVSLLNYQRMGVSRRIEFLSGLGFSEHFAESIKDLIFESDEFDRAIYNYADGSEKSGNVRALKAMNRAHDNVMSDAANKLETALDNMPSGRNR